MKIYKVYAELEVPDNQDGIELWHEVHAALSEARHPALPVTRLAIEPKRDDS